MRKRKNTTPPWPEHDIETSLSELMTLAEDGDFLAARDVTQHLAWLVATNDIHPMPRYAVNYLFRALYEISTGKDANKAFHLGKHQAWSIDAKKRAVDVMQQLRSQSSRPMSVRRAAQLAVPLIEEHVKQTIADAAAYAHARQIKAPMTDEISSKAYALVSPWLIFKNRVVTEPMLEKWYAQVRDMRASKQSQQ